MPTIIGVASVVFLLLHLIPGDPVDIMLGESAANADRQELREKLGLDRPLLVQYGTFLSGLARGDLGESVHSGRPVRELLAERFPATLRLSLAAGAFAVLIALPLGLLSAARPHSPSDRITLGISLLGVAIPNFWLGPMLIMAFSIELGWLPVSGNGSPQHLILPALTLGASMAAILTRMTRAAVLESLQEEYVRSAAAKGLTRRRIILVHAFPNALTPLISLLGLQFGSLLAGAVITETIFAWPGIGRLTLEAIQTRDYPLVQGCVLLIAMAYVLINLLTDLAYALADPRIRLDDSD